MKRRTRFLTEIGLGLLIVGVMAWGYLTRASLFESASLKTFDTLSNSELLAEFRPETPKSNVIKIVEIDDESVGTLGRWPWPRSVLAALIDELADQGAKVIGTNVLLVDEDQNEALEEMTRLHESFAGLVQTHKRPFRKKGLNIEPFEDFLFDLEETREALDSDAILQRSIDEAGNVVLPMYFQPGQVQGQNLDPLPDYFQEAKAELSATGETFPSIETGIGAITPLELFGTTAIGVGHSNMVADQDGVIRRISPTFAYSDQYYPSFGLELIREYKNLPRSSLAWKDNVGYSLQSFHIPVDQNGQAFLTFAGPAGTFARYSALDVLSGGLPEDELNNKIVLLGVTAPGQGQSFIGPNGERFSDLEIWANHMDNILTQRFISRPPWAEQVEWGTIALAGIFVAFLLPFLRARFSIPLALVLILGILGSSVYLFLKQGVWISPAYGLILMATGFFVSVGRRLIFTERGKELVEAESVETNKMLGLSFQGQGMLDLAFEKFRKCEIDDSMKELLYNLGLDMERKRQFSKAAAVYEHISTVDTKYKDIQNKIELLKKAGDGAVFGGLGKKGSDATVVVEGLGQNTTLGRYEITRELGRGAMGIVYLGKDPKINRQVAIKTLRFEDEVEEEQAKSIKERFFREAESAGNLNHPNIIRIFDAGEDQDVAYIAMELIEGHDLKKYCEKPNLLEIKRTLEIVTQVADGLDYAHKQGVVHRDIKPANIMMIKDGSLRITDFGIARIQATSKTATGAVLGTPAYMSPEQVNGKKVDGRADIFSLGVTLFELLTGEKPFAADSIAALLYRIANVKHPDPREYNANIPEAVVPIIDKAMAKKADDRYQNASEMVNDLRTCMATLSGGAAPQAAPAPAPTAPPAPAPASPPQPEAKPEEPKKEEQKEAPKDEPDPGDNFLSDLNEALVPENKSADFNSEADIEKAGDDLMDTFFGDENKSEGEAASTVSVEPDPAEQTAVTPKEDADKTVVLPPDQADKTMAIEAPFSLDNPKKESDDQQKTGT